MTIGSGFEGFTNDFNGLESDEDICWLLHQLKFLRLHKEVLMSPSPQFQGISVHLKEASQ